MTTLTIAAVDTAGHPLAHRTVEVAVIAGRPGGHPAAGGPVIAAPVQVRLDEDGTGEVDVDPTDTLDAPGVFVRCTVLGSSPTIVRSLTIPTGPSTVDWADPDLQVADPVIPEVGITRRQLDEALDELGPSGPPLSDAPPQPPGAASPGSVSAAARGDHVHPPPTAGQIGAATPADIEAAIDALPGPPTAVFAVADLDMSGGSWTELPGGAPRMLLVGHPVLVLQGDDRGLWTVTASGPCTPLPDPGGAVIALTYGGMVASPIVDQQGQPAGWVLGPSAEAVSALGDAVTSHAAETTGAHGGIVADDDPRLDNARTPTAHAASHAPGGSDPITIDATGLVPATRTLAGLDLTTDRTAPALRSALGVVPGVDVQPADCGVRRGRPGHVGWVVDRAAGGRAPDVPRGAAGAGAPGRRPWPVDGDGVGAVHAAAGSGWGGDRGDLRAGGGVADRGSDGPAGGVGARPVRVDGVGARVEGDDACTAGRRRSGRAVAGRWRLGRCPVAAGRRSR